MYKFMTLFYKFVLNEYFRIERLRHAYGSDSRLLEE